LAGVIGLEGSFKDARAFAITSETRSLLILIALIVRMNKKTWALTEFSNNSSESHILPFDFYETVR
jgi:hypothetical protein